MRQRGDTHCAFALDPIHHHTPQQHTPHPPGSPLFLGSSTHTPPLVCRLFGRGSQRRRVARAAPPSDHKTIEKNNHSNNNNNTYITLYLSLCLSLLHPFQPRCNTARLHCAQISPARSLSRCLCFRLSLSSFWKCWGGGRALFIFYERARWGGSFCRWSKAGVAAGWGRTTTAACVFGARARAARRRRQRACDDHHAVTQFFTQLIKETLQKIMFLFSCCGRRGARKNKPFEESS